MVITGGAMLIFFTYPLAAELQHCVLRMMGERELCLLYVCCADVQEMVDEDPRKYFAVDDWCCKLRRKPVESVYYGYVFRGRSLYTHTEKVMLGAIYYQFTRVVEKLLEINKTSKNYLTGEMFVAAEKTQNGELVTLLYKHPSTEARIQMDNEDNEFENAVGKCIWNTFFTEQYRQGAVE